MIHSPSPWRFDGHGVNDANGQRICKVSNSERCLDDQRTWNPIFLNDSHLVQMSPEMYKVLKYVKDIISQHDEWWIGEMSIEINDVISEVEREGKL